MTGWPSEPADLFAVQDALAAANPPPWIIDGPTEIGGVWYASPTGSAGDRAGERAWAAAVLTGRERPAEVVVRGRTGAGYVAGSLALREGPLLEAAVRALRSRPDVLLVNATGRDHPRGAGLAMHLGAVLDVPTVGITDRPLLATGPQPPSDRWASSPLALSGVAVAALLRTRAGVRPLVVHPAWRTDLETALEVIRQAVAQARTPEPLRVARRAARLARARDEGRLRPS